VTDAGGDEQNEADEVREIERERLRALVNGEVERARQIHADDFQLINPAGGVLSRDQYLDMIASGEFRYRAWEPEAISVRLYGSVSVIRYRAEIEAVFQGNPIPRERYWHTDLYEKRDGRWQVVWSQATEIQ
jgi:hypothetical protein